MYTRLPEEEYINRLVIEFDTGGGLKPKEWKELTWDPPITMGEFLGKQVVGRLKRQSPVGLQVHEDLSKPPSWWSCWTIGPPSKSRGPNKNRK